MRYLVLSDIHGNWEALQAVIADAEGSYDSIVNCGDLVGYGPNPNEVTNWCRAQTSAVVRGNHDKACCGLLDMEWFNAAAQASAEWTKDQLTPENLAYLLALPSGPLSVDGFQILHGSPNDEDEYLVTEADVVGQPLDRSVTFFGHTHIQGGFYVHRNGVHRLTEVHLQIEETAAYLINSGSVGQPRDGDPRAGYALFDTKRMTVEYRRVSYSFVDTWRKIVVAGLPEVLGRRLMVGM